ncbi:hypothetical protein AAY473_024743 [Plecturocebus cupreus]
MPGPASVSMELVVTLSNESSSSGPSFTSLMQVGVEGSSIPGLLAPWLSAPFSGDDSNIRATSSLGSSLYHQAGFQAQSSQTLSPASLGHQPQDVSVWYDLKLPSSVLSQPLGTSEGWIWRGCAEIPGFLIWSMHQLGIKPLDRLPGMPRGPSSSEDAFIYKPPQSHLAGANS